MSLAQTFNETNQEDLEIIIQRYNFYKKKILQPLNNGHYLNCICSYNDQCYSKSKDFCSCYYIDRFPKDLCDEIVEKFGLEYMLNF